MSAALFGRPRRKFTPQEYLIVERAATFKSEFYEGEMFAMAGATREHNLITLNIVSGLRAPLRQAACETYASDMRVGTPGGNYFYPDVVAVCGKPAFAGRQKDTLENPVLIVEVLSKSTARYDREVKLVEYQRLPSVREVLLVVQDRLRVEHHSRAAKTWSIKTYSRRDSIVDMRSVHCSLALSEVYDGIAFT